MEDLLLAILSGFAEFLGDAVLEIVFEILVGAASRGVGRARVGAPGTRTRTGPVLSAILFFLLGTSIGALSVIALPHPLFHRSKVHGLSLLVSPILTGLVMSQIGRSVRRRGRNPVRIESFTYGFTFALGMALIRFFFTQ